MKTRKKILKAVSSFLAAASLAAFAGGYSVCAADNFLGFTTEQIAAAPIKPYITVSSEVLSLADAQKNPARTVTVSVKADGQEAGYYGGVGLHIYFDERLSLSLNRAGMPDVERGDACSILALSTVEDAAPPQGMKGLFVALAGSKDYGCNGEMFSFAVELPDDVKEGDVFPIDISYVKTATTVDMFTSSLDRIENLMNAFAFTQGIYNKDYNPNFKPSADDIKKCKSVEFIKPEYDGYIAIEGGTTIYGDADLNGSLSISDIVCVLQYSANHVKNPLSSQAMVLCDVDGDGDVNATDAYYMQQADAKIITLPVKK